MLAPLMLCSLRSPTPGASLGLRNYGERIKKVKNYPNNLPGAKEVEGYIVDIAEKHKANPLLIATEATGFYDWHLLEFLSQSSALAPYSPKIYRFNPKLVKSFKEIDSLQDRPD